MPTRKVQKIIAGFLFLCGLVASAAAGGGLVLGQDDPTLARYDVAPRPIELIPPGTVIEKTAPEPYTHLVIKTFPRLGAGDMDAVNEMTKQLASFLHTSLVAKVAPVGMNGQRRYRLEEVATGFSTVIRGRGDTVLSPDTERKLGANLSFFGRMVLAKCYQEQQKSRYVVRSDTMAIVDTPAVLLRDKQHRRTIIRYAMLVSERSGRLDSLVWMVDLDAQGAYTSAAGDIHWLAPNMMLDGVMHVDASQFTLGIPSDTAFACVRAPYGERSAPIPELFVPLAGIPQFTKEQAKTAEIQLWTILQQLASQR
jgi:hypothetical protein